MTINFQQVINSPRSIQIIATLGRVMPLSMGYRLADLAAERIAARRDSEFARAVRLNQWVVRGEKLDRQSLDLAVLDTFRESARSIFDLHHFLNNPEAARDMILVDPAAAEIFQRSKFSHRGLMIVGIHLSGFDLVLQWLAVQGFRPLTLTIPDPQGASRLEFEMRKKTGVNLVPASPIAFRQALRFLQQGGTVLTGMDRPIPDPEIRPLFFGYPAALPTHHIFLACRAHVPLVVMASFRQLDGKYILQSSPAVEMDAFANREIELQHNAEKVLAIAEGFIRPAPHYWTMSRPVWPQLLDQMPD